MSVDYFEPVVGPRFTIVSQREKQRGRTIFVTTRFFQGPELAVYGQIATSFLIPELSDLYVSGAKLQSLQSEYTTNYQLGMVYTRGRITADADVYLIDATNLQVACNVPDPTSPTALDGAFCNAGKARFDGVEGEAQLTETNNSKKSQRKKTFST